MSRVILFAAIAIFGCKLIFGRWPWELMGFGSARTQSLNNARKLLGVRGKASREEINDAHRKLISVVHPDRGGTNDQVYEADAARDTLLNELR